MKLGLPDISLKIDYVMYDTYDMVCMISLLKKIMVRMVFGEPSWLGEKLLSAKGHSGLAFYPARAVTVSQCPHSEVGQDFLLRRRVTLTETAVTRKRKV